MKLDHDKLFDLISAGATKTIAKYLQKHPVDLNSLNWKGWTPLMLACDQECFEVVRLLVDSGADVNQKAERGWSPLHTAVSTAIDSDCKHGLGRRVGDAPVDIV